DQLADFSNYGATRVHLGAPGVRVLTTAVGATYDYIDGTSFASPYTAGAIALLAASNPFASPEQLRDAIFAGVTPVPALEGQVITGGRLNVDQSLRLVGFPGPYVTAIFPGRVSGPTNTIAIAFSEPIEPAHFDVAGIELRRANGDRAFNSNDVFLSIPANA